MDVEKLNVFSVVEEVKILNRVTRIDIAFLTSASESEFKDLVSGFSYEKFDPADFTFYANENGYFCTVLAKEVRKP
jgi:hypothetical protein